MAVLRHHGEEMTIKYRDTAYEDPIQRPRYTGVPTFMRTPYCDRTGTT